jgi:hypothetical protein
MVKPSACPSPFAYPIDARRAVEAKETIYREVNIEKTSILEPALFNGKTMCGGVMQYFPFICP